MNCCICSEVKVAESNDPRRFELRWMLTILSLEIPNTPVLGPLLSDRSTVPQGELVIFRVDIVVEPVGI